jgi:hypothetical protein
VRLWSAVPPVLTAHPGPVGRKSWGLFLGSASRKQAGALNDWSLVPLGSENQTWPPDSTPAAQFRFQHPSGDLSVVVMVVVPPPVVMVVMVAVMMVVVVMVMVLSQLNVGLIGCRRPAFIVGLQNCRSVWNRIQQFAE